MKNKLFNEIYVGGCSHAHGVNPSPHIVDKYHEKYGVEKWQNFGEICFGKFLSDHYNVPVINDSFSGGGLMRLSRKFWDYILLSKHNLGELSKVLFILDIPSGASRLDVYFKSIERHLIINLHWKSFKLTEDNFYDCFDYMGVIDPSVDTYSYSFKEKTHSGNEKNLQSLITEEEIKSWKSYMVNNFNVIEYENRARSVINGILYFLLFNKLKFFIIPDGMGYTHNNLQSEEMKERLKTHIIKDYEYDDYIRDIQYWGELRKNQIMDDIDDEDGHPGYFAHKTISELIIQNIDLGRG